MVSPSRRRAAVQALVRWHKVSERRACKLIGLHRSTMRYRPQDSDYERKLVTRMVALAEANPFYGYKKIWALLRQEGWHVNRKRIERLWAREGLAVPPVRKGGRPAPGTVEGSVWKLRAEHPDHVWAYDFMTCRTADGRPFRILNILDEFTRESVASVSERTMGTNRVKHILAELFVTRGVPRVMRSDNGPEFVSDTLVGWLSEQGVDPVFIEKGRPQQNGYVERFNGLMRNELLNTEVFGSMLEARMLIDDWRESYNNKRPHGALRHLPPSEYHRQWRRQQRDNA
jgi:transposase InsO family protein